MGLVENKARFAIAPAPAPTPAPAPAAAPTPAPAPEPEPALDADLTEKFEEPPATSNSPEPT